MGSILSMQWPVPSNKRTRFLPDAALVVAGAMHQLRGRISVLRGTLSHNDILRARGYRQELVGMLQRCWKRDRDTVEAWVDTVLKKTPSPLNKPSWRVRTRPAAWMLHQET